MRQVDRCKRVADNDMIGNERAWKMGRSSCTKKDKDRETSASVKSCANDLSVADSNTSQRERGRLCRGDKTEHDSIRRDEAHCGMAESSSDGFSKGSDSESSKRPEDRQEGAEVRSFASDSCDISFW